MLTQRKCLSCGQVFAEGDIIKAILPKCPHCGSRLTIPKLL